MVIYNEKGEKLCRFCKKEVGTMKHTKSVTKEGKVSYYLSCRKCNTEIAKSYRKTPNGRASIYKAVYKSINKFAYKQKARYLLNYHLKRGNIKKPDSCTKCNKVKKLEGHHIDYSKPLEVIWVCRPCHSTFFD